MLTYVDPVGVQQRSRGWLVRRHYRLKLRRRNNSIWAGCNIIMYVLFRDQTIAGMWMALQDVWVSNSWLY